MSKKISKNISTYELAIMVAGGFAGVDKRFAEVEKKFESFDERFSQLESTIFVLDSKVGDIYTRVKKMDEVLEPVMLGYSIMQKEIQSLNFRIEKLERKVGVSKR